MKLGVLTCPLYSLPADDAFAWLGSRGVECVELGTGGYPGNRHCDADELLADGGKLGALKESLKRHGLTVAALSVHSNHVHPDKAVRDVAAKEYTATLRLAEKLGVRTVVTFSGCPGDHPGALLPNWVTCAWPPDFARVLDYQWGDVLVPFWIEAAKEAESHGVKVALEMHPGFCVYNPATLLRLREAAGDAVGANFDPSHLFWQGIDPPEAIKALKGAIHHFHAKDTKIEGANVSVNGVLDTGSLAENLDRRAWAFRTVGYGHGEGAWRDIVTALRLAGYDGAICIEHEDALMSFEEGLEKAIEFLKPIIIRDRPSEAFWA